MLSSWASCNLCRPLSCVGAELSSRHMILRLRWISGGFIQQLWCTCVLAQGRDSFDQGAVSQDLAISVLCSNSAWEEHGVRGQYNELAKQVTRENCPWNVWRFPPSIVFLFSTKILLYIFVVFLVFFVKKMRHESHSMIIFLQVFRYN